MIADRYDAFFLDLDGVVYVGDRQTDGAASALDRLRSMGKDVRFLTNNPTDGSDIVCRLKELGIESKEEEVITSGTATARVLSDRGIGPVWVLGHGGLRKAMTDAGLSLTEAPPCEAVVVGWDDDVTLGQIRRAALAIRQGALFVATNEDPTYPSSEGVLSGVGVVVDALIAGSGTRPLSVGKPWTAMFEQARRTLAPGKRAVMIGDTPYVDVLGAHRAGIDAILMGSAETYPGKLDFRNPDGRIDGLGDLFDESISMGAWDSPTYPWPESVEPGVAGVVLDESGRVLLMRRSDNGRWGIPSGHVEPGETVQTAVVREIREETGLKVEVVELIGLYSDPVSQVITYPDSRICHFVTSCFLCRVMGGSLITSGPETLDAGFFDPHALPEPLMSMHPRWLADALAPSGRPFVR
jgi:HAD superfamily hydrolase (TIGR01450 family)